MVWHLDLFHSFTNLLVLLLSPGCTHLFLPMPHSHALPLLYSFRWLPRPALPPAPYRILLCPTNITAWHNGNTRTGAEWASCVVTWENLLWNQITISLIFNFLYWQWFHVPVVAQIPYVHYHDAGLQGSLSVPFSWRGKKWYHPRCACLGIKMWHYSLQTVHVYDPAPPFLTTDIKAWTTLTLELPILGMWVTANWDEWGSSLLSYCFRLSADSRDHCICYIPHLKKIIWKFKLL